MSISQELLLSLTEAGTFVHKSAATVSRQMELPESTCDVRFEATVIQGAPIRLEKKEVFSKACAMPTMCATALSPVRSTTSVTYDRRPVKSTTGTKTLSPSRA